jgi:carboxylesterase
MASSAAAERWGSLTGLGGRAGLSRSGRSPAVLALHGFGGTPREVELVLEAARDVGLAADAPLLPGHGTHARALALTRWTDWYDSACTALDELTARPGPVLVTGLSLGSLLAIHLAALHPGRVGGLALLANALWLRRSTELALHAARWLGAPNLWTPKLGPDIRDREARRDHPTYRVQPLHPALEVLRAGQRSRRLIQRVRVPTLLVHGAHDRVCPPSNLHRAAALLPTRDRRVLMLPRSGHVITRDLDRAELRHELRDFFTRFADT